MRTVLNELRHVYVNVGFVYARVAEWGPLWEEGSKGKKWSGRHTRLPRVEWRLGGCFKATNKPTLTFGLRGGLQEIKGQPISDVLVGEIFLIAAFISIGQLPVIRPNSLCIVWCTGIGDNEELCWIKAEQGCRTWYQLVDHMLGVGHTTGVVLIFPPDRLGVGRGSIMA